MTVWKIIIPMIMPDEIIGTCARVLKSTLLTIAFLDRRSDLRRKNQFGSHCNLDQGNMNFYYTFQPCSLITLRLNNTDLIQ